MSAEIALQLFTSGFVVLPSAYVPKAGSLRKDWENAFTSFPEFKHHPAFAELDKTNLYVCGASAFAGNASVTHCAVSREHREAITAQLLPVFQEFVKLTGREDLKMAHIPDRVQVRGPKRPTSKDAWHRDFPAQLRFKKKNKKNKAAQNCFSDEIWVGGWENCDDVDQHFQALEGSHNLYAEGSGFSKIGKAEHEALDARLLAQANRPGFNSKGLIVIPPRHFVLSFANLVHAVNPASFDKTSVKAFLGAYRFTARDDSGLVHPSKERLLTHEEQVERMDANDVQIMSSGQYPAAYPANYLVCRDAQLPIFEAYAEKMLVPGAMKLPLRDEAGNLLHKAHLDETRSFKSLKELGAPLFPAYKPHEYALLRPSAEIALASGEVVPLYKRARVEY